MCSPYSVHQFTFKNYIGDILIVVHPDDVTKKAYHFLGMGKIVEPPASTTDQLEHAVYLHILAVGTTAATLVTVGQVVLWPKINLALPVPYSSSEDTMGMSEQQASDDKVMNYALQYIQLGIKPIRHRERGDSE